MVKSKRIDIVLGRDIKIEKILNTNIQQLRGVAVIAVVLFHLNFTYAKTGYLGVDTFFVISGFLMAMIYGDIQNAAVAKQFYFKRAVRLLPAYWFTILTTFILTILICLPHETLTVKGHAIWAFIFLPNLGFWREAEYWGGSYFRPFLHLWSLGVEFQFYLIYPIISKYFNSNLKRIALIVISLFLYIIINQISAKTAFYFMPTRLWQFMLGILAFNIGKKINFKYSNYLFNLFLAILCIILLSPMAMATKYVYFLTIPTTLIVAILIAFSTTRNGKTSDLKIKKFLEIIGKYSYSIYLVHYPAIIFLNYKPFGYNNDHSNSLIKFIAITIFSFGLVRLSYRYFEKEIHLRLTLRKISLFGISSIIIFGIVASMINIVSIHRFSKEVRQISVAWLDQSDYRCGKFFKIAHPRAISCPIGEGNLKNKLLLIGNSHADSIKTELAKTLNAKDISLYFNVFNHAISLDQIDGILKEVNDKKISKVVFHSRSNLTDFRALERLLSELSLIGVKSYYILPVPEYNFSIPAKVYESLTNGTAFPYSNLTDYSKFNQLEINEIDVLREKFGLKVLETGSLFCTPRCRIQNQVGLFYFDPNHLTLNGSKEMSSFFRIIANG